MKINHLWKICVIFLFVSFNSYGKTAKSTAANSSGSKSVRLHVKKPTGAPINVTMTASATLHAVDVAITPVYSGTSGGGTFYSTSTQYFTGYVAGTAYNVQISTPLQRCHITLNGQTQDNTGGHTYVLFTNLSSFGSLNVSVVAF